MCLIAITIRIQINATYFLYFSTKIRMCVRSIFYYRGLVQEIVFLVFHRCLYNKQNITCPLVDTNFIFSCSTRYLTRSLRSLVRYRVEHSKIKFVSTRGHVISSIYIIKLKLTTNCQKIDMIRNSYVSHTVSLH